jgi:hypothetical protein
MIALVVLLFSGFFIGALGEAAVMLRRKRTGGNLEGFRLMFFFAACLLLVCLFPLWVYDLLTRWVWMSNLAALIANLVGWALTFRMGRSAQKKEARPKKGAGVRTYRVYYRGAPYGLVTKEAFEKLMEGGLLKKQQTVELVDDFETLARQQGISVRLFTSRDSGQTLIMVEALQ